MPNYRRAFVPNGCWFFTHNLLDRGQGLLIDHIDTLRQAFAETQKRYPFDIAAIVVLPDHLHAVWTLPPDDADFSTRWRLIKMRFAKSLPIIERRSAVRKSRGERGVWQRRFWEHLIRDDADFARHVEYCYINPIKHGLVRAGFVIGRIHPSIATSNAAFSPSIGRVRSSGPASSANVNYESASGRRAS